jgi:hypothetical protein
MSAHLFMRWGFWMARLDDDLTLPFRTFEGAAAWAKRMHSISKGDFRA